MSQKIFNPASRGIVAIVILFLSLSSAFGASSPFAEKSAPKDRDWEHPTRWRDVECDGRAAVKLTDQASYINLPVSNTVPPKGRVMLKIEYYGFRGLKPFRIGIGGWGTKTELIIPPLGKKWRVAHAPFPAETARRHLENGSIKVMIQALGKSDDYYPPIGKVSIYVPDQEEVAELYRDSVKTHTKAAWKATEKGGFIHGGGYDDDGSAKPSQAEAETGAIPFIRDYMVPVYPMSVPKPGERGGKTSIRIAPGEFEPVQVAVKPLKYFFDCKLVFDFVPSGLKATAKWVECAPLRCLGGSRSKKWRAQPNRLWPEQIFPTVNLKKNQCQAWWVTIKANSRAAAGVHQISMRITDGLDYTLGSFTIEVEVLPFQLPRQVDYAWGFYTANFVTSIVAADMRLHGCNSLSCWSNERPWSNSGSKVDFSQWDNYFAKLRKLGMNHAFIWFVGTKDEQEDSLVVDGVGEENFISILKGLNSRVETGKYPRNFMVTIDEACMSDKRWEDLRKMFSWMREFSPALKRLGISLDRNAFAIRHKGMIENLSCNGDFARNSEWCRENGCGMYTYTVFSGRTSAGDARYNAGFNPWRYGAAGTFGWALDWNNGSAFNDLDGGCSDWAIVLPNWTGRPIATPAWEGWREGVDDRRYIEVYQRLVETGKADAALLEEIKRDLKEVRLSGEAKVGDSIFTASVGSAEKLNQARNKLIDAILAARKKK